MNPKFYIVYSLINANKFFNTDPTLSEQSTEEDVNGQSIHQFIGKIFITQFLGIVWKKTLITFVWDSIILHNQSNKRAEIGQMMLKYLCKWESR